MSNNALSSIGSGELDFVNRLNQAGLAQASQVETKLPQEEVAEVSDKAVRSGKPMPNVSLHFKIDAQTHEVTVLVLDKNTREVIRTIPPEELNQLQQGELLELFR